MSSEHGPPPDRDTVGDQVFSTLPSQEATIVVEASKTPLAPFELPGWVEVFTRL